MRSRIFGVPVEPEVHAAQPMPSSGDAAAARSRICARRCGDHRSSPISGMPPSARRRRARSSTSA